MCLCMYFHKFSLNAIELKQISNTQKCFFFFQILNVLQFAKKCSFSIVSDISSWKTAVKKTYTMMHAMGDNYF